MEQPPAKRVKLESVTEQELSKLPNVSSVGINQHWSLTLSKYLCVCTRLWFIITIDTFWSILNRITSNIFRLAKEKAGAEQCVWPGAGGRNRWQLVHLLACQKSVSGGSWVVSWLHNQILERFYCSARNLKILAAVINKLHIRCSFGGGEWRDGAESCQTMFCDVYPCQVGILIYDLW